MNIRNRFKHISLMAVIFLLSVAIAAAAEITVTATVDRNRITLQDQLTLTVTVAGASNIDAPELPDLPDFDMVSQGSSSRVQIINGRMSAQKEYQYILIPKRQGLLTIGPATVRYKGKTFSSDPITVRVEQATATPGETRDLFITAEVDNASPYVGEQVLYSFKFFRRVRVTNASLGEMDFQGFQVEDVGKETTYTTVRDGIRYQVTEIRKLLYPVQSGELTIPAVSLQCRVPVGRSRAPDPFFGDDFFNFGMTRTRTKVLRTEPLILQVRPLPEQGKPPDFTGLVGRFHLTARLGKAEVEQGDSVTLTMTIEGEGDLSAATRPEISDLQDFKVYDDQPTLTKTEKNGRIVSTKTFKTALVPLKQGPHRIREVSIRFLNPETGAYEKASDGPLSLNVIASSTPQQVEITRPESTGAPKQAVRMIGRDILPIATDIKDFEDQTLSLLSPGLLLFFLIPPLFFLCALVFRKERERRMADRGYVRRKKVFPETRKALKQLRSSARKDSERTVYARLSKILQAYLGAKVNLEGEARTPAELKEALGATLRDAALLEQTHALLVELEAGQFAPGGEGRNESGALIQRTEELIRKLEKAL